MMSLEVKALGSPQGLMVKGTHIPVPRGVSNGDVIVPPHPQKSGGGKDMAGLNRVTLPSKCLLCDGEPLSLMRTKESQIPHPASVVIGGGVMKWEE